MNEAEARILSSEFGGGFHRKPTNWAEVGLPIPMEILEGLKQYTAAELGIENDISRTFSRTPEETVFLVGYKNGLYLVSTGGGPAPYARYVRYVGYAIDRPVPDTLEYVLQAFDNNGYNMRGPLPNHGADMDGIDTATFIGINDTGKEMYRCTFVDAEGKPDSGIAYVWTDPVDGKKKADF